MRGRWGDAVAVIASIFASSVAVAGPWAPVVGAGASGTVKFFNSMKGFGFIQRDDGQPDAFVHISAVEKAGLPSINEGDRFEFDLEVDRRGKFAAVTLRSAPAQSE